MHELVLLSSHPGTEMPTFRNFVLQLRRLLLLNVCLAMLPVFTYCQQMQRRDVPPELQATDPEINGLLQAARSDSDSGKYEAAFSEARKALQLAQDKGLVRDKAIAEDLVAVDYFLSGKLADSLKLYQSSLQDAIDSSNLVLEADVLVAIASSLQIRGNLTGELDLLAKALDRANQSKNLYVKARVLGELGRAQLFSGKTDEGRKSIEEALRIDKANSYNFEPLHSVYLGYAILTEPKPDLAVAIGQLEASRDLAIKESQYIALVLAENALGATYIRKGEARSGIAILEGVRDGKIMKDGKALAMPEAFRSATALPALGDALLEALAQAYEIAQEPDKALQTWNELYTSARSTDNMAVEGEAAIKIAMIYRDKKDIADAVNYFSISAEISRKLENNSQLSQALIGEALFLIQMGKGEQAIPLENQITEIGRNTNNRQLQFFAYGVLAEIYQPAGNFQQAQDVLEKAQALIKPGPMDSELDNRTVIEDYTRLAEVYQKLNDPIRELIALEKGFAVASFLKDDALANNLAITLKKKIDPLGIEKLIDEFYKAGKLEEALAYSVILSIYKGGQSSSGDNQYWNLIWEIPFHLVNQPGGAEFLKNNIQLVDCILGLQKIPIFQALSEHYLYVEHNPQLASDFENELISFLSNYPGKLEPIRARATCTLANIDLLADIAHCLPCVWADRARVRQVLINLIDNAIRFTPNNGTVIVQGRVFAKDSSFLCLSIVDTGCGISPEDCPMVFDRLAQVKSLTETSRKGLGLGLFISKELVSRQGGRIWVDSQVGHGSTFHFTLPVFSLAKMCESIFTPTNLAAGYVTLLSIEVPTIDEAIRVQDLTGIRKILERCVHAGQDLILPPMTETETVGTFFIIACAETSGAEAITKRLRRELDDFYHSSRLKPVISVTTLQLSANDQRWEERIAEVMTRIDNLVQAHRLERSV